MQPYKTLRLILGDQLNADHSWFKTKDPEILYVIAELHQEQHYVKHHIGLNPLLQPREHP